MTLYVQDPQEKLDHTHDWAAELGADTISTSTWAISPTGPTLSSQTSTATTATVWVESLTAGKLYTLTNSVITAAGRKFDRQLFLLCEAK
jgi:hypothetical protein